MCPNPPRVPFSKGAEILGAGEGGVCDHLGNSGISGSSQTAPIILRLIYILFALRRGSLYGSICRLTNESLEISMFASPASSLFERAIVWRGLQGRRRE